MPWPQVPCIQGSSTILTAIAQGGYCEVKRAFEIPLERRPPRYICQMISTNSIVPIAVTKTIYTVLDFLNWQRDGQLNLRPYFQRGSVWTPKARSYLIDTLLRGYPIPVIYIQNKTDNKSLKSIRQVVDGQQRLRTLISFIDSASLPDASKDDDFTILAAHNRELGGAAFDDLSQEQRDRLTSTEISVHVLPSTLQDKVLLELFARLNSTGERLNDQELRNAKFHGAFKSVAYALSYESLESWNSWNLFPARALTQMKHVEFTSELILLLLNGLQSKSKAAIDRSYSQFDETFPHSGAIEVTFSRVLDLMDQALAPDPRVKPFKHVRTQSWMYTIFGFVASSLLPAPVADGQWTGRTPGLTAVSLRRGLQILESKLDEQADLPLELEKALRGASTDKRSRQARLEFLADGF